MADSFGGQKLATCDEGLTCGRAWTLPSKALGMGSQASVIHSPRPGMHARIFPVVDLQKPPKAPRDKGLPGSPEHEAVQWKLSSHFYLLLLGSGGNQYPVGWWEKGEGQRTGPCAWFSAGKKPCFRPSSESGCPIRLDMLSIRHTV